MPSERNNQQSRPCACVASGGKPLTDVSLGHPVAVACLHGEESVCQRLREMGFCEAAVVEKVTDNGALICRVCNTKVAISKKLAESIIVNELCHSHEVH